MANLDEAVRAYRDAQSAASASEQRAAENRAEVTRKRQALTDAIVEAGAAGMRQVDIIRITGYSRERVRQILRAGGVEPD